MWGTQMVPRPGSSNFQPGWVEGWRLALFVGWGQEFNNSQTRPGTPSLVSPLGLVGWGNLGGISGGASMKWRIMAPGWRFV